MTLRAELAAAAMSPVPAGQVPALPTEAAQVIWVAAWTAAQVQVMARAEKLAAERDAALLQLETMNQDVVGLVSTVDEQSAALDQAAAAAAVAAAAQTRADAEAQAQACTAAAAAGAGRGGSTRARA